MPVTIESPAPVAPSRAPDTARVAVVRTRPETVIEDYGRVMALAGYQHTLARDLDEERLITLLQDCAGTHRDVAPH